MSSRKKTILVAYDLNPNIGSESRKADNWLKIIAKYYDVDVFTDSFHKHEILKRKYDNVTFHFIESNVFVRELLWKLNVINVSNLIFFKKVKSQINKFFKKKDHSLIHCITPAGIYSYNDFYTLGIPILAGPLGGALPTPKGFEKAFRFQYFKNIMRDAFYKYFMKTRGWKEYFLNARKIIVGTKYLIDILPTEVREKTVVAFDTVVDDSYFIPGNNDQRNGPIKKIIFSGILESKKGVTLLIEAVRLCLQQGVNQFTVELAGYGDLKDQLETMIKEHNLSNNVKLIGFLSKEAMLKKYQESDIYCLPTLREPGGGAILEAMACGLPVITSNYGGPAYSVTDECGIKIAMTNYDQYSKDLADAIIDLVTNNERRIKMGLKARERIEKEFSLKALEKRIIDIYGQVVGV